MDDVTRARLEQAIDYLAMEEDVEDVRLGSAIADILAVYDAQAARLAQVQAQLDRTDQQCCKALEARDRQAPVVRAAWALIEPGCYVPDGDDRQRMNALTVALQQLDPEYARLIGAADAP